MSCLFCKIIAREIPSTIVLEDDDLLAFRDIHPGAPKHALIIPKKHIVGMSEVNASDGALLGKLFLAAKIVAAKEEMTGGYRVVVNQGPDAGQSVFHLHVHVLGGRTLAWPPG